MSGGTAVFSPRTGTGFPLVSGDAAWTRVRVFGTRVWLAGRLDSEERQRRQRCGLGAIRELDLLDVLMDIPAGLPIPIGALRPVARRALERAPAGALDFDGDTVVRRAVPVVRPLLAVVTADQWQDGLVRASRFASYCPRMVLLPDIPDDPNVATDLAARYGIGLAVRGTPAPEVLVEPLALTDWQPTPAWWWFSETVLHHLDDSS